MRILILLLLSLQSFGQSKAFKMISTTDSHGVNSWPLDYGYDSIWLNKIKVRINTVYDSVVFINMADAGGRAIYSAMPMWYTSSWGNAEAQYSIDTILKQNPDLIIICMTGNHTVNHMPADSVIWCFNYLIDTLNSLGKTFILTGQTPRQKTFTGGMTTNSYYDSSVKINNAIIAKAPRSYVNMMNMEGINHRPIPELLSADSLHWSEAGNTIAFEDHMDCDIMDSIMTPPSARVLNFSLHRHNSDDVIDIISSMQFRTIYIYGSNDRVTFTLLNTFKSRDALTKTSTLQFDDEGYIYYKAVIITGNKIHSIMYELN